METDKSELSIGIIGAGNLGRSLATGLLKSNIVAGKNITVSDPSTGLLNTLQKQGIKITVNNVDVAAADVVFLAVKPSIAPMVLGEIKDALSKNTLLISAVGGLSIAQVQGVLGKRPVIRIMPNLCVSVNESATCWTKSREVTAGQIAFAKKLLQAVGSEFECRDEGVLAAATVISGSGPAYIWYIANLLEKAAVDLGMEKSLATKLVAQTLVGSAMFALQTEKSYKELVDGVATKGGITQEALEVFADEKLDETFKKAIKKAYDKAKILEQKAALDT